MPHKLFSERLNKELDAIDMPSREEERVESFAKMIKIPKFKAAAMLNGLTAPDEELLQRLAEELEVNPDWLMGRGE